MASILLLLLLLLSTTTFAIKPTTNTTSALNSPTSAPSLSPVATPSLLPLPPSPHVPPPTSPSILPPIPPQIPAPVLPPNPPPAPPQLTPPVPPPTPHLPENNQDLPQPLQFNILINAIFSTGDFTNWDNLLSQTSATLFLPSDAAFITAASVPRYSNILNFLDPLLFTYHAIPLRFTFSQLLVFPTGARLPTLLTGKTLLITNNSAANFTINGIPLTHPDLFQNAAVAVHGIGGLLDYTVFGNDEDPPEEPPEKMKPSPSLPLIDASEIAMNRPDTYPPVTSQTMTNFPRKSAASSPVFSVWLMVLCFLRFVGFEFG